MLPDRVTIGGMVLGIFTATLRGYTLRDSLIGAAVGFFGTYIPFDFLYRGFLGRRAMGLGDAKLLALAGAWFGWPGTVFALFGGAIHGTLYVIVTRLFGIETKLPDAVLEDIAELEKAAAEGDDEAKKALAEDPLTEEHNPFILLFFKRLFGIQPAEPTADETSEEPAEDAKTQHARIPFGPFIILAILELLFAGQWLQEHLLPFLWPPL